MVASSFFNKVLISNRAMNAPFPRPFPRPLPRLPDVIVSWRLVSALWPFLSTFNGRNNPVMAGSLHYNRITMFQAVLQTMLL